MYLKKVFFDHVNNNYSFKHFVFIFYCGIQIFRYPRFAFEPPTRQLLSGTDYRPVYSLILQNEQKRQNLC